MSDSKEINLSQLVANDDGRSNQKTAFWTNEGGKRVIKTIVTPTSISRADSYVESMVSSQSKLYSVNNVDFLCSDKSLSADIDTRTIPEYQSSAEVVALSQFALERAGFGGKDVVLCTSLPVDDFYKLSEINAELVKRKKAVYESAKILNVVKEGYKCTETDSARLVTIDECVVMPEAVGSYLDYILDDEGNHKELTGDVLVIDIGSYTIDVCVVAPGCSIKTSTIKTYDNSGFLAIQDALSHELAATGAPRKIPQHVLDATVRTKTFKTLSAQIDVSEHVDKAVSSVLDEKIADIKVQLGDDIQFLEKIILVGAGAESLRTYFKALAGDNIYIPADPQVSNAKGHLKFMTYYQNRSIIDDVSE